ncbi:MAG: EAL domain-containing protein [Gammaproteobacteria bacterium]|jgi:diguanylate cyclase (GGDEF)-like protein/PAS domain S-box-containing protein|nr:EAL domain-containing protein [Gammaproteobacteria bacterium]
MLNVRQIIPSRISLNELPNNQSSTDSTFTLMFKSVLKEKSGRNLDGYLDYRGSKVIGVWIWDDELNIGLATEQDFDEAFKALNTTRVFFVLFCLIIIIGFLIAAFLFELSRKKLEREIEERKSAEKEMKKLSRAIEASPSAIMITNIEGTIEYVNPKFFELTGYSKKDAIGHKTNILKSGETSDYFYEELWKTISSGGEWREDLDDRKKDGDIFRARESITGVKDKKGKITHYIGILDDVSEEFKLSEKLSYQASHDALTCLINRREFEHRTQQLISTAKKHKDEHALCFIDLDQFKVINDTSGHVAGDNLLNQLGRVLRSTVRNRDTLARLGGDEFGVLIENCSLEQANRVVTTILQSIQNFVFEWEGRSFRIGASIGLVAINETTSNPIEVLKQADSACYMAKDLGRNRIHIYKSDDAELALRQGEMHWVSRINQALEENRFQIFAQPIIALDSSEGEHYELLIRMLSEDGKIIQPGAFLPAAERYDLIEKIDLWVIKNAFTILASHSDFVEKIDFISINLSGPSLTNKKFLETIMVLLRESEVLPQKICFEVTETVAISNLNAALTFIKLLKEIGCKFALDDFGSGLSSFGYLKNLPVNYLKIDGMFVKDMVEDPIDYAMVKSINQIGQVMGMKTIAEFVENDEIKGMLKAIGVNYAQGYGIGKPRPLDEYF